DVQFDASISTLQEIGLCTTKGTLELDQYRSNVIETLERTWRPQKDVHVWALGKIMFLKTLKPGNSSVHLPLLSPALFRALEAMYETYPEALKMVSQSPDLSFTAHIASMRCARLCLHYHTQISNRCAHRINSMCAYILVFHMIYAHIESNRCARLCLHYHT